MTRPAPPPTRYGLPVVQRRPTPTPTGVAPPPTRFGSPVAQRRPDAVPNGVAPPPTRFGPAPPTVQAKAGPPGPAALQMVKKTKLPPRLKSGKASDFVIANDHFVTIQPSANVLTSKIEVCNGGKSMQPTVHNGSSDTWEVGLLQAVESYTGKEIYQNNTVTYTFNTLPLKDATGGRSVFYDGQSKASIKPGETATLQFSDTPWAYPVRTDSIGGNLVTVERDQSFTLWLWARRNTRECLVLKTYHWGINSSYDVQRDTFTVNVPNLVNSNTPLTTIKAQTTAANNRNNLKTTVT